MTQLTPEVGSCGYNMVALCQLNGINFVERPDLPLTCRHLNNAIIQY